MNHSREQADSPENVPASFAFGLDPKLSAEFLCSKSDAIERQHQIAGPDILVIYQPDSTPHDENITAVIPTTFFPSKEAKSILQCIIGGEIFTFAPINDREAWAPDIEERNQKAGLTLLVAHPTPQPQAFAQIALIAHGSNFPGDRDLHRGLMLKNKLGIWDTNENEGTKFYNGLDCVTQYQPPELFPEWWIETREATLKQLDERFRKMRSEVTADVIDILFHHWYHHRNPFKQEKAAITLSQLCEYRSIQPQKKNLVNLWQAMRDARSFRLIGDGIDAALFEMDSATVPQPNLWGLEEPPRADVAYFYSPGFFLAQAIKENPIYLAPYVRKVWELDPYRYSIAKKLARFLRAEWRMNTQKYLRDKKATPTRYRTWRSILDAAGVDVDEYLNSPNPIRLRKDIETALVTLYDIEAIAECGPTIYHPQDRATLNSLPRKGAMKAWLQLRVCIDPPADVSDALQESNIKRIARTVAEKTLPKSKTANRKPASDGGFKPPSEK